MMPSFVERVGQTWMWVALIALLFVVLVAWAADPLGWADDVERTSTTIAASEEWTVRPEGPAVPVDLPDVPVKAVPADRTTAASSDA